MRRPGRLRAAPRPRLLPSRHRRDFSVGPYIDLGAGVRYTQYGSPARNAYGARGVAVVRRAAAAAAANRRLHSKCRPGTRKAVVSD